MLTMRYVGRVLGYGLAVFVVWMVALFIASAIFMTDNPTTHLGPGLVVVVALGVVAWIFARRFHPSSMRSGIVLGFAWAALVLVITLVITIPNGTTRIMYTSWAMYVAMVVLILGATLAKRKNSTPPQ